MIFNLSKQLCTMLVLLPLSTYAVEAPSHADETVKTFEVSDDAVPTYTAEIRRTAFGVPHIKASNAQGIGYGVGYAYAQDNFCVTAEVMVTVRGERSKYFGQDGTYDPMGDGGTRNNLSSDFYYKYLNQPDFLNKAWKIHTKESQRLIAGYAAGFNRYLNEVGSNGLSSVCANQPWVRKITPLDVIRLVRHLTMIDSEQHFIDAIYQAQPPKPHTRPALVSSSSRLKGQQLAELGRLPSGIGSNGAVFGKEATESGAGLLLSNSHFPWTSAFRYYQVQLTIPGQMDVMGASLSGLPIVVQGFNANLGWSHQVDTAAHFTLFKLQLDSAHPTRYVVDGESRNIQRKELRVEVKVEGGLTRTVKHNYYLSEHGPLVVMPNMGINWDKNTAFALRDANMDNDRLVNQYWAMNQAKSLDGFKRSLEKIMGVPWANVVAVDKPGKVYFGDITPVPNVSSTKLASCVPAEFKPYTDFGLFVLDGHRSACNWGNVPGTPQKGIFAAKSLPSLQRTDYMSNSNDSAWLANPAKPLTGYSPIISRDGYEQGGRTRTGLSQIANRLAGTDGLPGKKFNLENLAQVAFSNRSGYAELLLPGLKAVCKAAAEETTTDGTVVNIGKGCDVLTAWDGKANLDSVGWPLFQSWRMALNQVGIDYWAVPFDAKDPVNTPNGLRIDDPTVLAAMAEAINALNVLGIDYRLPWGEIQVAVRGNDRIPIHGGDGDDIYNAIDSKPIGDGQLDASYGSSAIWMVSFEGDTPNVQGVLTYSQSTDPESPHYADQTRRFSNKQWITFPFSEFQITHDPEYSTLTINE
jgi:acyl-homoserine-lactone acylase